MRDGILWCDIYLFGRTTFEMLALGWSAMKNNEMGIASKLNSMPKVVVSSTLQKGRLESFQIINGHNPQN